MSELTLRRATPDDIDDIHGVVARAYRAGGDGAGWTTEAHLLDGHRTDHGELAATVADPSAALIVALSGQRVVGCIRVDATVNSVAHFGLFAVDPDVQSSGIGAALLTEAEDLAAASGASVMALEVVHQRTDLIAWYRRRGYVATGETFPFPYGDERFGLPRRDDLYFEVFHHDLSAG